LLGNAPPDDGQEIFCGGDIILQLEVVSAKTGTVVDQERVIQVLLGAERDPFWSIVVVPL